MSEIEIKRRLQGHIDVVVRTNDQQKALQAFGLALGALGDLFGLWTGEQVRLTMTAAGQSEGIDMVKAPGGH